MKQAKLLTISAAFMIVLALGACSGEKEEIKLSTAQATAMSDRLAPDGKVAMVGEMVSQQQPVVAVAAAKKFTIVSVQPVMPLELQERLFWVLQKIGLNELARVSTCYIPVQLVGLKACRPKACVLTVPMTNLKRRSTTWLKKANKIIKLKLFSRSSSWILFIV